jgi:hypothetical protein
VRAHQASPSPAPSAATLEGWSLQAFGLAVVCDFPLVGAEPAPLRGEGRTVEVRREDSEFPEPSGGDTSLLERRLPDGSLGMRVEQLEAGGYRIDAPGHGSFAIAEDGALIRCALADAPAWLAQRPLFGQALPLVATLQGLELFHASAAVINGHAVGFVGPSGAGKTSLAAHLTARGAALLTDDVLSLECREDRVLAYPGVRMANVAREQLDSLSPAARARLGRVIGLTEKVHMEVANMPGEPARLDALYFVERGTNGGRVAFERVDPPEPRHLLGATFMPHIVTPTRLATQLHTCAAVAASVATFRVLAPWSVSAAQLAETVERHVESTLA